MIDINIWFYCFLASFIYIGIDRYNTNEISVQRALNYLKKSLINLIVFYQSNYPDTDQIVLIKKWLDNIDFKNLPPEQKKLFKDYVSYLE